MNGNEAARLRQKELEWPTKRRDQLRILRNSRVGDAGEKLLLHKLDDHIGDGTTWRMSISQLADEMEVSMATAYRKLQSLKAKQLVIAEDCGGRFYAFQIVWSNLVDFADSTAAAKQRKPRKTREKPTPLEAENLSQIETSSSQIETGNLSQIETSSSQIETAPSQIETGTSYKRPISAPKSAPAGGGENRPSRSFRAEDFPIPSDLGTPAFRDAWREWCAYRRTTKRKPISEHAARLQMNQLQRAGPAAAVDAIQKAIANDWQGLFPSNQGSPDDRRRTKQEQKAEWAESEWQRAFGSIEPTDEDR